MLTLETVIRTKIVLTGIISWVGFSMRGANIPVVANVTIGIR
jgi:hypothetical protein